MREALEHSTARVRESAGRARAVRAWADVAVVVVVLIVTNLVAHLTAPWASVAAVPAAAVILIGLMRLRGVGWRELGFAPRRPRRAAAYAFGAVLCVVAVVCIAAALPPIRRFFLVDRYATVSGALIAAMVVIPLQTVIPEELAFRGALQSVLTRAMGARGVFVAGSLLFGLWHIVTSLGLTAGNEGLGAVLGSGTAGQVLGVAGAVVATSAAGAVLVWLRRRSDGVLAPIALHWSLNGAGALAAAVAWQLAA